MSNFRFPESFLWGAATSAHQVEGGNHNDWSAWEKVNAERLAREAESKYARWLSNWPEIKEEAENPENYISGKAADHYNRFREDFDIARELGHNAHRFSIEWSRIEPEEGKFDENAIEHYRHVLKALRERGLEPFVTLWHWTNPLWVGSDGWESKKTIAAFQRYAERMVREYFSLVKFWMPLNEPGTFVGMGYVQGLFPPQKKSLFRANCVFKNLMQAYRGVYCGIKKVQPNAFIGMSHYATYMEPYGGCFYNKLLVKVLDYVRNWRFLDAISDANDFIGIQYYHHDVIALKFGKGRWGPIDVRNENKWTNDMGWEIFPEGIYHLLRRAGRYHKPIYITENGTADGKDAHRAEFIREHLRWIAKAIADGVDVRGYLHWSLLDNFEWDKGFWPRFGLVEVDYKTMERKIRPSALEYKKIILSNSIE